MRSPGALMFAVVLGALLIVAHLDYAYSFPGAGVLGCGVLATTLCGMTSAGWFAVHRGPRARRIAIASIGALVVYAAVTLPVIRWQQAATRERGNQIIGAIAAFQRDQGHVPGELAGLVPRYIESVPRTALGIFRSVPFGYAPGGQEGYRLSFPGPGWLICQGGPDAGWSCDD